jgi:hypothetical protein
LKFEHVSIAHVRYMVDGDMFKLEAVGDEKINSWNTIIGKLPSLRIKANQLQSFF